MWGAFVSEHDTAAALCLPFGFAFHEHGDAVFEDIDLFGLSGGEIGEVIGEAFKMGHAFLQDCKIIHGSLVPHRGVLSKAKLAPGGAGG